MWPDVVGLVISHLSTVVTPQVVSRVPDPRPDELVQVRRVGGIPILVRDQARLDVWCWALTDPDAMDLALQVRQAIWGLAGTTTLGPVTYRVSEFMGPRQDDDPLNPATPRVWATYDLSIRADDAIWRAP